MAMNPTMIYAFQRMIIFEWFVAILLMLIMVIVIVECCCVPLLCCYDYWVYEQEWYPYYNSQRYLPNAYVNMFESKIESTNRLTTPLGHRSHHASFNKTPFHSLTLSFSPQDSYKHNQHRLVGSPHSRPDSTKQYYVIIDSIKYPIYFDQSSDIAVIDRSISMPIIVTNQPKTNKMSTITMAGPLSSPNQTSQIEEPSLELSNNVHNNNNSTNCDPNHAFNNQAHIHHQQIIIPITSLNQQS